jgi:DNA-binding MarR family transcriptional regulator
VPSDDDTPGHDPEHLRRTSLPELIALAGHVVNRQWDRITQQHGVSAAGANALLVLKDGPVVHREVARRCWLHPSTMTGIVDTLVRDALVIRTRSETDRRQVLLALTPRGSVLVRDLGLEIEKRFAAVENAVDERAEVVRQFLIDTILTDATSEGSR